MDPVSPLEPCRLLVCQDGRNVQAPAWGVAREWNQVRAGLCSRTSLRSGTLRKQKVPKEPPSTWFCVDPVPLHTGRQKQGQGLRAGLGVRPPRFKPQLRQLQMGDVGKFLKAPPVARTK